MVQEEFTLDRAQAACPPDHHVYWVAIDGGWGGDTYLIAPSDAEAVAWGQDWLDDGVWFDEREEGPWYSQVATLTVARIPPGATEEEAVVVVKQLRTIHPQLPFLTRQEVVAAETPDQFGLLHPVPLVRYDRLPDDEGLSASPL
jgi:hypothetical protein